MREERKIFYDNGNPHSLECLLNGKLHNENGPALRSWWKNGQIGIENYYLNGKLHNENGPAYLAYHSNGRPYIEVYYLNGKALSKEEFENRSHPCAGKKVTVDGKEYILTPV